MNRVDQVNWLSEFAHNIVEWLGDGTAEELVTRALDGDGMESWGTTIPEWFDEKDRQILIEIVKVFNGESKLDTEGAEW